MKKYFFAFLVSIYFTSFGQLNPSAIAHFCDSMMNYGIHYPMIPGASVSVVSSDSIYLSKGYGYSDYEKKKSVTNRTLFQLGSVGKVLTTIAALQQIEYGNLALHENVNNYLSDWKIHNPYDQVVTLSHLLTHTAGFNEHLIGYLAKSIDELDPLAIHLKNHMPSLFQEPGININYSNYGYALAGHLVELTSKLTFIDYIDQFIFDSLGMDNSTYFLPDNYREISDYARGYQWRETFEEVECFPRHALPAGSIISNSEDMALLMQALLGKNKSILSKSSYQKIFEQQFSNHPLLTGYTYGMEVQNLNGNYAIAKGGQVPGFLSLILLIPDDDIGIFVSLNTETDNFSELFFESFKDLFYPSPKIQLPKKLEVELSEYIGHYGNQRTNHESIEELFMLYEGQFRIYNSSNNSLQAYHNGKWHEYSMIKKDVFQNASEPSLFLVFERDKNGEIKNMYRNVQVGGIQVPSSYVRLGWFERPRFMNDEYPVLLLILLIYPLLSLIWLITYIIRKKNPRFLIKSKINWYYHAAALMFVGLFFWNIFGFFVPLLQSKEQLLFGLEPSLLSMRYVNVLMAITSVLLIILTIMLWFRKEGNSLIRVFYSLYSIISMSYIAMLYRWHFLNINL